MSRGGTASDLDSVGKGEGAEERWERSRSRGEGMRGGEKRRGSGSTVERKLGVGRALWEDTLTYS